jgi:pilus assembly protein CpaB
VKRRIIAAAVAILVAVVSGILLISYVTSADQRAMAGMRTEQVLVATAPVPQGTRADELGELVALRSLPAKAVVPGALTSVTALRNKITTTELQPGEQLLASRFADPSALQDSLAVQVPKGFSEVSIQLDPQRAVGNNLSPGDRVGVYISLGDGVDKGKTHLVLHQVLVTRIQGVTADQAAQASKSQQTDGQQDDQGGSGEPAPQAGLMITMAVSANDAEQVVFAGEYGHIWLSLENKASTDDGTRIVTEKIEQQ